MWFVHLSHAAIFGYEENSSFEDSPLAQKGGGDGCENPMSELLTFIKRKNVKKIGDFLNGQVGVESSSLWVSKFCSLVT